MNWTAIVLTCPNSNYTFTYQKELEKRKSSGFINKETILLVVEDPKSQIGSGGATLNALLVLAEHISAKKGLAVINPDVLMNSKVLLVHSGRILPYEPCGRPFVSLPLKYCGGHGGANPHVTCNLDVIIDLMSSKFAINTPPGVWVCSSDMILTLDQVIEGKSLENADACLLMVASETEYGKGHGVCQLDENGEYLENIHFKCKDDNVIKKCKLPCGRVPLVSGVVYLSVGVANTFLLLHTISPLDACTYLGFDSGVPPIQLSLFFDFLLAMCPEYPEEKFIGGGIYGPGGRVSGFDGAGEKTGLPDFTAFARTVVYKHFKKFRCKTLLIKGTHTYLTWPGSQYLAQIMSPPSSSSPLPSSSSTLPSSSSPLPSSSSLAPSSAATVWKFDGRCHAFLGDTVAIGDNVGLFNCSLIGQIKIGSGSLMQDACLTGDIDIGEGCILKGIQAECTSELHLNNNMVMIGFFIGDGMFRERCVVTFGCHDNITDQSTFCNFPWAEFKSRTGIKDEDLWVEHEAKSIFNARLFPTFPWEEWCNRAYDIYSPHVDYDDDCGHDDGFLFRAISFFQNPKVNPEFLNRWKCQHRVSLEYIYNNLNIDVHMGHKRDLFHTISYQIIKHVLVTNQPLELRGLYKTACLDGKSNELLRKLDKIGSENYQCPGICARVLANIGDLLGEMAGGEGGLRSGPASNQQWKVAFRLLEEGEIIEGFEKMTIERKDWMDSNIRLVRAARHYEGACQILIRQAVMSAQMFITTNRCDWPAIDQWVICKCPARIDISGGWSDTPPITYESGGAVFNAAITVDGLKPISAMVRRIPSMKLIIHLEEGMEIVGSDLDFLQNYNQPSAAGSLIKACFISSRLVEYPSQTSLFDQLKEAYHSGFEVRSSSSLPRGSGLGTSSIMAGAIIACMWRASGYSFDIHSLNHAVLYVEQLLTTGGGWQDQVGGLCGGLKLGHTKLGLPLEIEVNQVKVSSDMLASFNDRLILVYTGQTRLAKNLLQNVIRNWYARDEKIMTIKNELVDLAYQSKEAFEKGNLAKLGQCITQYWMLKKALAPGSEPMAVTSMIEALRDHCYGISMAGAGGGGFMYLLTKKAHDGENVKKILNELKNVGQPIVCAAKIDEEGVVLLLEGGKVECIPYRLP